MYLNYYFFSYIFFLCLNNVVSACCVNVTVAILMERSSKTDMPFLINRTLGLVNTATAKSKEIVKHSANLNFILRYADVPACTSLKWGALASELYHNNDIHAVIGPGLYLVSFYSRTSVTRKLIANLPRLFRTRPLSP